MINSGFIAEMIFLDFFTRENFNNEAVASILAPRVAIPLDLGRIVGKRPRMSFALALAILKRAKKLI
jgi:hypothetical protein